MKIDRSSPWFLLYTAVASAVIVVLMYWLLGDDGIDWTMVVLLSAATVVGVLIGNRLARNRT